MQSQSTCLRLQKGGEGGGDSSSDDEREQLRARTYSLVDEELSSTGGVSSSNPSPSNEFFDSPGLHPSLSGTKRKLSEEDKILLGWNSFVRKGTRFKTLFDEALTRITTEGIQDDTTATRNDDSTSASLPRLQLQPTNDLRSVAAAAREKATQCILLQKQLDQATVEAAALAATNKELQLAIAGTEQRLERTTHALRAAGKNAANAREDADAAEATAASLAMQLQAFQEVIDETKRASQVLYKEHEEISEAAHLVETKCVQIQAELVRSQNQRQNLNKQNEELAARARRAEDEKRKLEAQVSNQTGVVRKWKQAWEEASTLDQAYKKRIARVEAELQQAQAMLVEATLTVAEAQAATTVLKDTIEELTTANCALHERVEHSQAQHRTEQEKLHQSLHEAQQDAQSLRLQASSDQDQIQKLTMEKAASDMRAEQLQSRIAGLERRLKDSSSTPSGWLNVTATNAMNVTPETIVPPSFLDKENDSSCTEAPGSRCSICMKASVGIMKLCQCGNKDCKFRAHASCVNRSQAGPSVSHPGTPAQLLPVVLCKTVPSWATTAAK
jgi:chromosome segregation ATPase